MIYDPNYNQTDITKPMREDKQEKVTKLAEQ